MLKGSSKIAGVYFWTVAKFKIKLSVELYLHIWYNFDDY